MPRTNSTMIRRRNSTWAIFDQPPSTVCSGFLDQHGLWNNGFACPMENSIQYFCCTDDEHHYCCPADLYISSKTASSDQVLLLEADDTYSSWNSSLHAHRQFEQFQKLFLPIFLLTSSVLFLIGIAIWFWLYKHKTFYAFDQDDRRVVERQQHQRRYSFSHPSTEV